MELNEYQEKAISTCMASCDNFAYMSYGLVGEVGELMGKIAKHIRKENMHISNNEIIKRRLSDEEVDAIIDELGDCLWFIAGIAHAIHIDLNEVGVRNNKKLESRKKRNVIDGDGDNR